MGWADYLSRHPGAPAPSIPEYDQNYSVSVITKLYSFIKTLRQTNITNSANQRPAHKVVNHNERAVKQNTHSENAQTIPRTQTHTQCINLLSVNQTKQQCVTLKQPVPYFDMSDSVSSISSVPPDFEVDSEFTIG